MTCIHLYIGSCNKTSFPFVHNILFVLLVQWHGPALRGWFNPGIDKLIPVVLFTSIVSCTCKRESHANISYI